METPGEKYIKLENLTVYTMSRELSKIGWEIYEQLSWKNQKIIGDQFITATDSIGANIAEGYARFHFLDKIRFYYQARGSLVEASKHWLPLLSERNMVNLSLAIKYTKVSEELSIKLQNFITTTAKAKYKEK